MPRQNHERIDSKIATLLALQASQQQQQAGSAQSTEGLVKMLGELYGLSAVPAKLDSEAASAEAQRSHARYYDAQTSEFADTAGARQMAAKAGTLRDAAVAGLDPDIITSMAKELGFSIPEKAKPQGDMTSADMPKTKTEAPATDTPGRVDFGGRNPIGDIPLGTANMGVGMYNHLLLPPANLLGSLMGTPPLKAEKYMKDYSGVTAPDWMKELFKVKTPEPRKQKNEFGGSFN